MSIRKDQARTDSTSRPAPGSVPSSTLLALGKRWRRMELREVKKKLKKSAFHDWNSLQVGWRPPLLPQFSRGQKLLAGSWPGPPQPPPMLSSSRMMRLAGGYFPQQKQKLNSPVRGIFRFLMISKNVTKPETQAGSFEPSVAPRVVTSDANYYHLAAWKVPDDLYVLAQ